MIRSLAGVAASVVCASAFVSAAGQPMDYAGYRVVRVEIDSAADLDAARSMGLRVYGERFGIGPVEYLASPAAYDRLGRAGMSFEVLDDSIGDRIKAERARQEVDALFRGATFFDDFRRFEDPAGQDLVDIMDFLGDLAASHPQLMQIEEIGTTHEGRTIRGVMISGDPAAPGGMPASEKPLVFINAGIHAREWISPSTACYIIDRLVTTYGADPRVTSVLDQVSFYVIPVSNPDGYEYSHTNQRLWRKNRRNNGDGTFGVDLNRNFGFEWGGLGADTFTSSDIYRGPGPFSEPETRAIRDKAMSLDNTVAFVDVHAYSQLILYPWGYDVLLPPEPDLSTFETLSAGMRDVIQSTSGVSYTDIPAHDLYPASGAAEDWGYGGLGVLAWTFELRPASANPGFQIPPSQILPVGEEIYEAFIYLADNVIRGVAFDVPSSVPTRVEAGVETPVTFTALPIVSGPLDSGSAAVYYRAGSSGAFTALPAIEDGGSYSASLPAAECGETVEFYLEIESTGGIAYRFPAGAPNAVLAADVVSLDVAFEDSFASDLGWAVSGVVDDGAWTRGTPVNNGRGDPASDFDANNFAYLTDNFAGNSDVDGGQTVLTSPTLDTSAGGVVSYAYWLNDIPNGEIGAEDFLAVEVRSGGGSWTRVREYSTASNAWRTDELLIGSEMPAASNAQIRFIAADNSPGDVVEAAMDAIVVSAELPCENDCLADVNGDGELSGADFNAWLNAFSNQDPRADQNSDGRFDGADFNAWLGNFNDGCD